MKDGGPAFPSGTMNLPNGEVIFGEYGMTLRDWFAGKAMAARLSTIDIQVFNSEPRSITAQHAYQYADAMIEARKEQP